MTAKEYLMQLIHIDQRINTKLELATKLRGMATKATSTMSDMPKSDAPNSHSMENTIVKMVDLENEINDEVDRLVDLKREARQVIGGLVDPEQQLILEMRYLCCKSWIDIISELDSSETRVYRLHGLALKNIILPEKWE